MNQILLKNVIDILSQVVDLLYQENLQKAYMLLAAVLPKMEELAQGIPDQRQQEELADRLRQALEAMEDGDSTLLADLIQYEILEQLNTFVEE